MPNHTAQMNKDDRRRRRVWNFLIRPVSWWLRRNFGFSCDSSFDPSAIKGPLIILINHTNACDPLFTAVAFRNKPLSFVASEHLLRLKPWGRLLDRYFYIIPHKKGRSGNHTSQICRERLARGESVFLCAEGEQTWNGLPLPAKPHTGSLIKNSSATLVTYRIDGGYLARPRWSVLNRKGRVYAHPIGIYPPGQLAGMSVEEIDALIKRDLGFDVWEWQKARGSDPIHFICKKGGAAVGLEKAVCSCPSCGKIGELTTEGDTISCSCGFSVKWSETGFFEPAEPFETIVDWEAYDRAAIAGFLNSGHPAFADRGPDHTDLWPGDAEVTLRLINDDHTDTELCTETLSIDFVGGRPVLMIGGFKFDLAAVTGLAMILDNRIVFTVGGFYYELRAENTNLRKYLIAWEEYRKGES